MTKPIRNDVKEMESNMVKEVSNTKNERKKTLPMVFEIGDFSLH